MANLNKKEVTIKELMEETKNIKSEEITLSNIPLGLMGYSSEEDRKEGLKFLQTIVDATDGTPCAVVSKAMELMKLKAKGVRIDEIINVDDREFYINLKEYVAYNKSGAIVAEATEIKDEKPSDKVIVGLLSAKIKQAIAEQAVEEVRGDDDGDFIYVDLDEDDLDEEGMTEEEEWMEMHPYGWWNSPTDKGI